MALQVDLRGADDGENAQDSTHDEVVGEEEERAARSRNRSSAHEIPGARDECTSSLYVDMSNAHIDRVALHLYQTFEAANRGHVTLHLVETERGPVINTEALISEVHSWRTLARAVIQLGAVISEK